MDIKMEQRNTYIQARERPMQFIDLHFIALNTMKKKNIHEGQFLVSFPSHFNYIPKFVNVHTFA